MFGINGIIKTRSIHWNLKVAKKRFKKPKKRGIWTRLLEVWNYGNRDFVKQKLDFKTILERNLETSITPFNLQKWRFFGPTIVLAALIGVFVAMMVFMGICWCLNDNDKAPNQEPTYNSIQILHGNGFGQSTRPLPDRNVAKHWLAGICAGLKYLQEENVAHRGIKRENMLLSTSGHMKISDFGFAKSGIPATHWTRTV
ncbi:hypothetical protein GCK72_015519 [Caenorhabditis remanei]|uniref:Protein kinase domain-containing protein n=1 Tax=Caenorhabditis remanei TaxID=31234 RepID=A0A6A5GWX9_CAERE|nr:hypothetical protein GCK72_015519 [Caenorhabditis remanei]KAF1759059.1 hypothetical protein GCK72_015519 [Caenorhabditis remanei]